MVLHPAQLMPAQKYPICPSKRKLLFTIKLTVAFFFVVKLFSFSTFEQSRTANFQINHLIEGLILDGKSARLYSVYVKEERKTNRETHQEFGGLVHNSLV